MTQNISSDDEQKNHTHSIESVIWSPSGAAEAAHRERVVR